MATTKLTEDWIGPLGVAVTLACRSGFCSLQALEPRREIERVSDKNTTGRPEGTMTREGITTRRAGWTNVAGWVAVGTVLVLVGRTGAVGAQGRPSPTTKEEARKWLAAELLPAEPSEMEMHLRNDSARAVDAVRAYLLGAPAPIAPRTQAEGRH